MPSIPSMDEDELDTDSLSHDRFPSVSGQAHGGWGNTEMTDSDPGDMWLEGVRLRKGECIEYKGQACRQFLAGQYVMITSTDREEMLDIGEFLDPSTYPHRYARRQRERCSNFLFSIEGIYT